MWIKLFSLVQTINFTQAVLARNSKDSSDPDLFSEWFKRFISLVIQSCHHYNKCSNHIAMWPALSVDEWQREKCRVNIVQYAKSIPFCKIYLMSIIIKDTDLDTASIVLCRFQTTDWTCSKVYNVNRKSRSCDTVGRMEFDVQLEL